MDPIAKTLRFLSVTIAVIGFVFAIACGTTGAIAGFAALTYAMLFVFCGAIAIILT